MSEKKDKEEKPKENKQEEKKDEKANETKPEEKKVDPIILNDLKDFQKLAEFNSNKILNSKETKSALKPEFTLTYLKNIIQLLGPTLDMNQFKEILKISNNIFNTKTKVVKKVNKKGEIKQGKMIDRQEKTGDYDDDDNNSLEEDEEGEDIDFDDLEEPLPKK